PPRFAELAYTTSRPGRTGRHRRPRAARRGTGAWRTLGSPCAGIMDVEVVGAISDVETFAVGTSIRELHRLRKAYGTGRWRKRKGVAQVRLADGTAAKAEVHWYEAHGIGRKEM